MRLDMYKAFGVAILLVMFSMDLSALHPVWSQYDIEREYTIEGILKRIEIGSPHSFFHVLVVDEYGDEGIVKVEWGSAAFLQNRHTINRSSVRLEQQIRVRGYLSNNREDLMIWPMFMHTEYDLSYDRRSCNEIEKLGRKCEVLTTTRPLWPVLPENDQ